MIEDTRVPSDLQAEHDRVMETTPIEYRGYLIKPLSHAHQPFQVDGKAVYWGYNVIYASGRYKGCNAAPGAAWSRTIGRAKTFIDVMHEAGEKPEYRDHVNMSREDDAAYCATLRAWNEKFWRLLRERD